MSELLPAGKELDRLVAEQVMGWRRTTNDEWLLPKEKRPTIHAGNWCPSTEMAYAWQVVDWFATHTRCARVGWITKSTCRAELGLGDECGPTAMLAICYAALDHVSRR